MLLNRDQQGMFWALWSKAEAEVLPVTATRFEREALRRATIKEACGVTSLKEVKPSGDFDRVCWRSQPWHATMRRPLTSAIRASVAPAF